MQLLVSYRPLANWENSLNLALFYVPPQLVGRESSS